MDALLAQVNRDVAEGRYAAVVATSAELLDPVAAQLSDSEIEFIVDADDAQRAAALAIATSHAARPRRLSDVASDQNAARLRQLSEEVSRIATTLARLSTGPPARPHRSSRAARRRSGSWRPRPFARSFARGDCARASCRTSCLPIPRGTCCSICSRPKSRICACPSPACASPPRCRRPPRFAGSRRWSAGAVRPPRRSARRPPRLRRARARCEPRAAPLFRRGRAGRRHLGCLPRPGAHGTAARRGRLAQLVEHLVYTERVGGSSPSPPTGNRRDARARGCGPA